MPPSSAYLFLELATIVFFLGFCWEQFRFTELTSGTFWKPALTLAVFWFAIDQIAVRAGIWSFPAGGTLQIRILHLPLEEYLLFFIHTLMCVLLLRLYEGRQQ